MIRFFFWNVFGPHLSPIHPRYTRLAHLLSTVVEERTIDILVLAESPFSEPLELPNLVQAAVSVPRNRSTQCRLELFYRPSTLHVSEIESIRRSTVQRVTLLHRQESLLVAATHLPSLGRADQEESRKEVVRELATGLARIETIERHHRTLIVGDFNYSPFDLPLIGSSGMMAVASRMLAQEEQHRVGGTSYPYFYNPMWGQMGDRDGTPSGTYFRRTATPDCRFWDMPDQVLLRPDLVPYWNEEALQVITYIGNTSLLDADGVPDKINSSDHLPIFFQLNV